jgi:hypothetical protein
LSAAAAWTVQGSKGRSGGGGLVGLEALADALAPSGRDVIAILQPALAQVVVESGEVGGGRHRRGEPPLHGLDVFGVGLLGRRE